MKRIPDIVITGFILFALFNNFAQASGNGYQGTRPSIGLALSGGGARGFAHIGALKMLDSLNIPIDYIAGTSMGGIIGALYAVGYSGKEIEQIALKTNWEEVISDTPSRQRLPFLTKKLTGKYLFSLPVHGLLPVLPSGLIKGQKVFQTLSRLIYSYQNVEDFNDLPIPFKCVAVDIISGNEVILDHGSLALALRATMSIPTVFAPVEWGDSLLVDGFVSNNLPVDVLKKMGADIIISVNVGTPKKDRAHLTSILDILEQTINLASFKREAEAVKESDIVITPHLEEFSTSSFSHEDVAQIIRLGERAAKGRVNACQRIQTDYSLNKLKLNKPNLNNKKDKVKLHGVVIAGNTTLPFDFVSSLFDLKAGDMCTQDTINACIFRMKKTGYFKDVSYEIKNAPDDEINLIIKVKERQKPRIHDVAISGNKYLPFSFIANLLNVKPGMLFDTEKIDKNITELYGLGYFETIQYEIVPLNGKNIRLIFHIKEKPKRALHLGARFDNLHKFVGALNLSGAGFLSSEVRLESELQFGGLTRFHFHVSYPTRSLTYPVYPFLHLAYKDILTDVYNANGSVSNKFHDRSYTYAMGLGFLVGNTVNVELEYNHENVNLYPDVTIYDQPDTANGRETLVKLAGRLVFDSINKASLPSAGLYLQSRFENSIEQIGSKKAYKRFEAGFSWYWSPHSNHVFRLFGFYGIGSRDMPVTRYFYHGGPGDFVGADYQQLSGYKVNFAGLDYRVRFFRRLHATLSLATATHSANYTEPQLAGTSGRLYGAALGLMANTAFGPVKIQYARGFGQAYHFPKERSYFFITAGFKF